MPTNLSYLSKQVVGWAVCEMFDYPKAYTDERAMIFSQASSILVDLYEVHTEGKGRVSW